MAKIGTETYKFGGARFSIGLVVHDFDVCYTKKLGFYAKVNPIVVNLNPNVKEILGKTYDDAVKNYKAHCDKIYAAGIKQKKVIVYYTAWKFPKKWSKENIDNNPWEGWEAHNTGMNSATRCESRTTVKLQYYVMNMLEMGGNLYLTEEFIQDLTVMPSRLWRWKWSPNGYWSSEEWMNWEYMEYTAAAEAWFKSTYDKLSQLIGNVAAFFGDEPEQLLLNIKKSANKELIFKNHEQID